MGVIMVLILMSTIAGIAVVRVVREAAEVMAAINVVRW
jgi:hypothetical protein